MDYTVTIQEEAEKITHAVFHKSVEIVEGQYGHYIYKNCLLYTSDAADD